MVSTTITVNYENVDYKMNVVPNIDNPVYEGKSERVEGVEAALIYLFMKGVNVWEEYSNSQPFWRHV